MRTHGLTASVGRIAAAAKHATIGSFGALLSKDVPNCQACQTRN